MKILAARKMAGDKKICQWTVKKKNPSHPRSYLQRRCLSRYDLLPAGTGEWQFLHRHQLLQPPRWHPSLYGRLQVLLSAGTEKWPEHKSQCIFWECYAFPPQNFESGRRWQGEHGFCFYIMAINFLKNSNQIFKFNFIQQLSFNKYITIYQHKLKELKAFTCFLFFTLNPSSTFQQR